LQEIEAQIARVQLKLQELLKRQANLLKEKAALQQKLTALQADNSVQEKKIKLLEEQQQIFKAAASKLNEADKKAFDLTINRYIREIDKCIALLSE
jgi:chromosome segregation ATPase